VLVEKESGRPLIALRTNCGGEYTSHYKFIKFCEDNGIKRQLIAAYMPKWNSVCQWKNHTILNMVQAF